MWKFTKSSFVPRVLLRGLSVRLFTRCLLMRLWVSSSESISAFITVCICACRHVSGLIHGLALSSLCAVSMGKRCLPVRISSGFSPVTVLQVLNMTYRHNTTLMLSKKCCHQLKQSNVFHHYFASLLDSSLLLFLFIVGLLKLVTVPWNLI